MRNLDSVLLVDNNEIDNYINQNILIRHGVTNIYVFKKYSEALIFLRKTIPKIQLVIIGSPSHSQITFDFIDRFKELELNNRHGDMVLLSSSLNPLDRENAMLRNVRFIEKPLSFEKLLEIKSKLF
jgi:CheY-like chemotaxis protein